MALKQGFKDLVAKAEREVRSLSPTEVNAQREQAGILIVDLRDVRELCREGKIPGAVHVPRGMLEFWIDPECPYYKNFFDDAERIIFYCNKGWRSALATQTAQQMGLDNVCHMSGGFEQWVDEIGLIEQKS